MTTKKLQLKPMDTLVCRTPVFSVNDNLKTRWPDLKMLIKDSSSEFYEVIKDMDSCQLPGLNTKASFSVWKYFNRARYRSTPFGNFAAISFVKNGFDITKPLSIQREMISHCFADWQQKDDHLPAAKKLVQYSKWFQSNTSYYHVGGQLRYIRYADGQFELASVAGFDELDTLLAACRVPQNKPAIYQLMQDRFQLLPKQVDSLLSQLIECQLILTDQMANITGDDYFQRLQIPPNNDSQPYIIAERKVNDGNANAQSLAEISEYLGFIKDLMPDTKKVDLHTFGQEFSRKFDLKTIPLSIALDPETGVGYGDTAHIPQIAELNGPLKKENDSDPVFKHTSFYNFLLKSLINGGTVQLDAFNKSDLKTARSLPNTLSVMYHTWNNNPVLQSTGGCTANALLGRFTLACEDAVKLAGEIVKIEEDANPEVIFFDIAYQAEKRVDNVNRRRSVYNYELPVLTWPGNANQLTMDDIMVTVRNGEIILWSKQNKKRLVPRIASAYNYLRSDLAVYRFLCDLQHQHIQSDLTFNLQQQFPGLDHYPRVMYKNIVVSPASWKMNIKNILSGDDEKATLKAWLEANNITARFKCGKSDQTLCFDPDNTDDLEAFLTYCRQNKEKDIYIQEALIDNSSLIPDETGKPYLPQYIASYFHHETVYRSLQSYPHIQPAVNLTAHSFLPGSEWIYFEIYCNPLRANDILQQYISTVISDHKKHIQKWFFIRYTDPKPHIRLRLKVKDTAQINTILTAIHTTLAPLWADGLIADIQLKTYQRETERYGATRIDMVEDFFHKDSRYVSKLLSGNFNIEQLYQLTLKLMGQLYSFTFPDVDLRLKLISVVADGFGQEFNMTNDDFKNINKDFERLKTIKNYDLPASEIFLGQYYAAFNRVIIACDAKEKLSLVADLIHMHINRVFSADQRMHEAILYQYLQKLVKVQKYRGVAQPALL